MDQVSAPECRSKALRVPARRKAPHPSRPLPRYDNVDSAYDWPARHGAARRSASWWNRAHIHLLGPAAAAAAPARPSAASPRYPALWAAGMLFFVPSSPFTFVRMHTHVLTRFFRSPPSQQCREVGSAVFHGDGGVEGRKHRPPPDAMRCSNARKSRVLCDSLGWSLSPNSHLLTAIIP